MALGVDLESIWKLKFPPWNDVQVESQYTTDDLKRAPLSDPSSWPCYINMLHMAAQHPDLHMRSLKIQIRCLEVVGADSAMFEDDLKSLLQISTLVSLSLSVLPSGLNPGNLFLPTVARELQAHHHLMQELDLGRTNFLELPTEQETYLFQTVFSLPQLSQLTLKLAYSVVSLEMIHHLWAMYGSGERL